MLRKTQHLLEQRGGFSHSEEILSHIACSVAASHRLGTKDVSTEDLSSRRCQGNYVASVARVGLVGSPGGAAPSVFVCSGQRRGAAPSAMRRIHRKDLAAGGGEVWLPNALDRKYANAGRELAWHHVFPASRGSVYPRSGIERRHPLA